jgi:hypothetical protein
MHGIEIMLHMDMCRDMKIARYGCTYAVMVVVTDYKCIPVLRVPVYELRVEEGETENNR